jgi:phosphatidylglycerophosphate synthase
MLMDWQTKPTDRFILKWIKVKLSARITPKLIKYQWLAPWQITLFSAVVGCVAGIVFALGYGFLAGCIALVSQVLDGVDGQYARITGTQTRGGAFWDSALDRYSDGFMLIGLTIYLLRLPTPMPRELLILLGALAFIGSNLISYSTARAQTLDINLGKPTLASKGTRFSVMIVCALGSVVLPGMPVIALIYLVLHTNLVIVWRLKLTFNLS